MGFSRADLSEMSMREAIAWLNLEDRRQKARSKTLRRTASRNKGAFPVFVINSEL